MTREEAISVLNVLASFKGVMEYLEQHSVSVQDACKMAIKSLSQNCVGSTQKHVGNTLDMRCEDAISRKTLLTNLYQYKISCVGRIQAAILEVEELVEKMPSVQPRRKGHWINYKNDMPICSECGYIPPYERAIDDYEYSNFCPYCGAEMESEEC